MSPLEVVLVLLTTSRGMSLVEVGVVRILLQQRLFMVGNGRRERGCALFQRDVTGGGQKKGCALTQPFKIPRKSQDSNNNDDNGFTF